MQSVNIHAGLTLSTELSVLTTCTFMLQQVCTIGPSFFNTISGMHRCPIEGRHLVFNYCHHLLLQASCLGIPDKPTSDIHAVDHSVPFDICTDQCNRTNRTFNMCQTIESSSDDRVNLNTNNNCITTLEKHCKLNSDDYYKDDPSFCDHGKHPLDKSLLCHVCGYNPANKHYLAQHMKVRHGNEKPFKCHLCDYCTANKYYMSRHVNARHTNEKPFKCQLCDYCTAHKSYLSQHVKARHTDEKPYKCHVCDFCTVHKGYLRQHIKARHTNERPHRCHLCSYSTVHKSHLSKHIWSIHTPDKPY